MTRYEILVENMTGHCSHSYEIGDGYVFNGLKTLDGFCGGAYTTLFPILVALGSGARFEYEDDPLCKTKMACSDNGNAIFQVRLMNDSEE